MEIWVIVVVLSERRQRNGGCGGEVERGRYTVVLVSKHIYHLVAKSSLAWFCPYTIILLLLPAYIKQSKKLFHTVGSDFT